MDRYRVIVDLDAQHEQVMAFCSANRLNPHEIPAVDGLRIVEGEIRYRAKTGLGSPASVSEWRLTRMISPPEDHNLVTREVVAVDQIADQLLDALIKESSASVIDGALYDVMERQAKALAVVVQDIVATEVSR